MKIEVVVASEKHLSYVTAINDAIDQAAKARGTGIARRTDEYIADKIRNGKAIIALNREEFVGFCYIESREQVAAGEADYFIPGGIWSESECFKEIDGDQNFYIDENNRLVILFEEYEVAPGSAGMPQFTVESEILQSLLRQPSVLSPVGWGTE